MPDLNWYGEAIYPNLAARDAAKAAIEDFVDATQDTTPVQGPPGFPPGTEVATMAHMPNGSGPSLRWSYKIREDFSMDVGQITTDVTDPAIDATTAQLPITP